MIESFFEIIEKLSAWLWGPWTMFFIAFVSIFLTIKSKFFQIVNFRFIFSQTLGRLFQHKEVNKKGSISPFQATAASLAGTVGNSANAKDDNENK